MLHFWGPKAVKDMQRFTKQVVPYILLKPKAPTKNNCSVTYYSNPRLSIHHEPGQNLPFVTLSAALLLSPSFQCLPQPNMQLYVLLTYAHAVSAAWEKPPTPSFPPDESPLILYNPDYISFSCMRSFDKFILACQAQIHGLETVSTPSPHAAYCQACVKWTNF